MCEYNFVSRLVEERRLWISKNEVIMGIISLQVVKFSRERGKLQIKVPHNGYFQQVLLE